MMVTARIGSCPISIAQGAVWPGVSDCVVTARCLVSQDLSNFYSLGVLFGCPVDRQH